MNMHIYYDDVDYKQEREKQRTHIKKMLDGLVQPTKPADLIPVIAEKRCMEAYAVNFKGSKGGLPEQGNEDGGGETTTPEVPGTPEETEPEPEPEPGTPEAPEVTEPEAPTTPEEKPEEKPEEPNVPDEPEAETEGQGTETEEDL